MNSLVNCQTKASSVRIQLSNSKAWKHACSLVCGVDPGYFSANCSPCMMYPSNLKAYHQCCHWIIFKTPRRICISSWWQNGDARLRWRTTSCCSPPNSKANAQRDTPHVFELSRFSTRPHPVGRRGTWACGLPAAIRFLACDNCRHSYRSGETPMRRAPPYQAISCAYIYLNLKWLEYLGVQECITVALTQPSPHHTRNKAIHHKKALM